MKENSTFSMVDENGNKITYDVLFTFESEETGKNYIAYTDKKRDEKGNVQVYASVYYPDDPQGKLEAIETEKEWKVIQTILDTLQEEIQNNSEGNEQ
ncbi:DUF1292 domain-containing protein [bacterium]|nr:DUF1292 domain-containing protein [bacterium]